MTKAPIHSLALSVYFRNPAFGMKQPEILSRATAFLLSVDPPNDNDTDDGDHKSSSTGKGSSSSSPYSHLGQSESSQKERDRKRTYKYEPAGGPKRRAEDLGWLEFCPGNFRPLVHVVAASHVLAPWKWLNYYPQEWVKHVKPEHCTYSVDVFGPLNPNQSLAQFNLNPYPIHHPEGMDIAIIHLKDEETALEQMNDLGVEPLHLRTLEKSHAAGDEVVFTGFEVAEHDLLDREDVDMDHFRSDNEEKKTEQNEDDDTRIFIPYSIKGNITFFSQDRFLASTDSETPLPQGLCGGPTLDTHNRVCGMVEGIVPLNHEDHKIAGAAAFIPAMKIRQFVQTAERYMLERIIPEDLFQRVVDIKSGKEINDKEIEVKGDGKHQGKGGGAGSKQKHEVDPKKLMEEMVEGMRKHHSPEEVDAVLKTVERERKEVVDILSKEGGDVDEIIKRVRRETLETKYRLEQDLKHKQGNETDNR